MNAGPRTLSNEVRNLVRMSYLKGLPLNAVLNHIADTVRDSNHRFFESQGSVALALGTDRKCVRRQLKELQELGLISIVGERRANGSAIDEYAIHLDAVMALPAIGDGARRDELYAKLVKKGWGSEPHGEGSTAPPGGVESPTRHAEPYVSHALAEKRESLKDNQSAREPDEDHLQYDDELEAWVAAQQAEAPNLVPMVGNSSKGSDRNPPVARTHPKKITGSA